MDSSQLIMGHFRHLPSQSLDRCKTSQTKITIHNQQQHRNLNNYPTRLLTCAQSKPNETKTWFRGQFMPTDHQKEPGLILQLLEPAWATHYTNKSCFATIWTK